MAKIYEGSEAEKVRRLLYMAEQPKNIDDIPGNYHLTEWTTDKMSGTGDWDDMNEVLARKQGTFEKIGHAAGRLVGGTVLKLGQDVAYLGALANPLNFNKSYIANVSDDWFANAMQNMDESLKEKLPIYKSSRYNQMSAFRQMGTVNWWADEFNEGLQFMASMAIPGIAAAKWGGTGARMASMWMKLAKNSKFIPKGAFAETARTMSRLQTTAFMTAGEAMFEASDTKRQISESLMPKVTHGEINPDTLKPWTEHDVNMIASSKATDAFIANVAALALSNYVESGFYFKKTPKTVPLGMESGKVVRTTPSSRFDKFKEGKLYAGASKMGKGAVLEGLWEENIQFSIQDVLGRAAEIEANTNKEYSLLDESMAGILELGQLSKKERATNVLLGATLGALGGGRSARIDYRAKEQKIANSIKDIQTSYDALSGYDTYKKKYGNDVTVSKEEDEGVIRYYKTLRDKDGNETKLNISEEDAKLLESDNKADLEKGSFTFKEADEYEKDEDGNLITDPVKADAYIKSHKFISEIDNLIDLEESKANPNPRRLKLLYDYQYSEWVLSNLNAGTMDLVYDKAGWYSGFTAEDMALIGYDPEGKLTVEETAKERINQAKELEKVYNEIQGTFLPYNYTNAAESDNHKRKNTAYRIRSYQQTLKGMIGQAQANRDSALVNADANDIILNSINELAYQLQYEQMRQGRLFGIATQDELDNMEKLSNSIIEAKKEYNTTAENKIAEDDSVVNYAENENSVEAERQSIIYSDIKSALLDVTKQWNNVQDARNWRKADYKVDRPARSKEVIDDTSTVDSYFKYENRRSARQRLRDNIRNIRLHYQSAMLGDKLDSSLPLKDILEEITGDQLRIDEDLFGELEGKLAAIHDKKNRITELQVKDDDSKKEWGSPLTQNEYAELKKLLNESEKQKFDQSIDLFDSIRNNKDVYVGKEISRSDGDIRKGVAMDYINDGKKMQWDIDNNPLYADESNVLPGVISTLKNLKRIFEARRDAGPDVISSAGIESIINEAEALIKDLESKQVVVEKRKNDVRVKDQTILNEEIDNALDSIGFRITTDEDGKETVEVADPEIYNAIKTIIEDIDSIIAERSYVAVEAVYQLLREAYVENPDSIRLVTKAIEKKRSGIIQQLKDMDGKDIDISSVRGWGKNLSDIWDNPEFFLLYLANQFTDFQQETDKSNAIYQFRKDRMFSKLIEGLDSLDIGKKEERKEAFRLIHSLVNLKTFDDSIKNDFSIYGHVNNEYHLADRFLNTDGNTTHAMSNEQMIAARQISNATSSKFDKTKPFAGWTLLEGFAGTGKSNVVSRWLKALIGITANNSLVYGSKDLSATTIRDSLFPGNEAPIRIVDELINSLEKETIPETTRYIIIDEIGQISLEDIIRIRDGVVAVNKNRKDPLRVIALGDPNQITTLPGFSPLHNYISRDRELQNIKRVRPLTIFFRSKLPSLNNVVNALIDQNADIMKDGLQVISNTAEPWNNDTPLYGINGSSQFVKRVKEILRYRIGKDDLDRAIIVSDDLIEDYKKEFADELAAARDKLKLLTYSEAQSATFDEVYVDINRKFVTEETQTVRAAKAILAYNTAMYTAVSRARNYAFIADPNIKHNENTQLVPDELKDSMREALIKFKEERGKDLTILEKILGLEEVSRKDTEEKTDEEIVNEEKEETDAEEIDDSNPDIEGIEIIDESENIDDHGITETEDGDEISEEFVDLKEYEKRVSAEGATLHHVFSGIFNRIGTAAASLIDSIKKGDNVIVVVGSYKDDDGKMKRRVVVMQKVTLGSKPAYREVAVISKHDQAPNGYESLYEKFKSIIDTEVIGDEAVFASTGRNVERIFSSNNISPANTIATGKIREAHKRKFVYKKNGVKLSKNHKRAVIENMFRSQYPFDIYGKIWGRNYNKIVRNSIDAWYENSEWRIYGRRTTDANLPNTDIRRGWPYLVINDTPIIGITNMNNESRKPTPLYLRMKFRKLTQSDEVLKPVNDFMEVISKIEAAVSKDVKEFRLGNAIFNRFVRDLATGSIDEDMNKKKFKTDKAKADTFRDLGLMFGIKEKDLPAKMSFRELYKVKYGKSLIVSSATRVLAVQAYNFVYKKDDNGNTISGPAQLAFNKLAWANPFSNGIILRNKKKKSYAGGVRMATTGRDLLGSGWGLSSQAVDDIYDRFQRKIDVLSQNKENSHLTYVDALKEQQRVIKKYSHGHLTLDQLKLAFGETMNLVLPVSAKAFNKDTMTNPLETVVENTFSHIIPAAVVVDFDSRVRDQKEETIIPATNKAAEKIKPAIVPKKRKRQASILTGTESYSERKALRYLKRLIPDLSTSEVQAVNLEKMISLNDGEHSWGLFMDGVIYLLKGEGNTVYKRIARHEAFHKVWHEYITPDLREGVVSQLILENESFKRRYDETSEAYEKRIEEELAFRFQEYKDGRSTFSGFLKELLEKLLQFFGFIEKNQTAITDTFDMINRGVFGDRLFESNVTRTASDINEYSFDYYSKYDVYFSAKKFLLDTVNEFMRPTEDVFVENGIIHNAPLSFNDAIAKTYNKIVRDRDEGIENPKEDDASLFQQKIYSILSITNNFQNIVKDSFPSADFVEPSDEELESRDEDIEIYEELKTQGIIATKETEVINPESKLSQRVRSMLSTITYTDNNGEIQVVPFKLAYKMFINVFSGFKWRKSYDENTIQAGNKIPIKNKMTEAIREIVIDLFTKSHDRLASNMRFEDANTFAYSNKIKNIRGIHPEKYKDKGIKLIEKGNLDNPTFFAKILNELSLEINNENLNMVSNIYKQYDAIQTLQELQASMGSLYPQNVFKGKRERGYDFYSGERSLTYRYHEQTHRGIETKIREELKELLFNNIISAKGHNFWKDTFAVTNNISADSSQEAKEGALNKIAKLFGYNYASSDSPMEVIGAFNNLILSIKPIKATDVQKLYKIIKEDSSARFATIEKAITNELFTDDIPFNYLRGDGKKGYLYILSNFTMDLLRTMLNNQDLPAFLTNSEFFRLNIFNERGVYSRSKEKTVKGKRPYLNKIYRYINHDSLYDVNNERITKMINNEDVRDTLHRIFQYMFMARIQKSPTGEIKYVQPFHNIGERGRSVGAEIDVLNHDAIKSSIRVAIEQEANRPAAEGPMNVENYGENIKQSYLSGLGSVVERKPGESPEVFQKNIDKAIDIVYNSLLKKARESWDKYGPQIEFSSEMEDTISRLREAGYNIPEITKSKEGATYFENTTNKIMPTWELFYLNNYINGLFLTQLSIGDRAFYKDYGDILKRIQLSFSDGYKGIVGGIFGMKQKFKVSVSHDLMGKFGEKDWGEFKKILGDKFNATDGVGFMTEARYHDITHNGFPEAFGFGDILKPVYWHIDENGVPRAIKYSAVRLSPELKKDFPILAELEADMLLNKVDEYIFTSSMKVGFPMNAMKTVEDEFTFQKITPESIVELDNEGYRIQLNAKKSVNTTTKQPSAAAHIINADGKNPDESAKIFENLGKIIQNKRVRFSAKYRIGKRGEHAPDSPILNKLRGAISESVSKISSLSRIYDFLVSKTDDKYDVSINIPILADKMALQLSAMFNKAVTQVRFPGADLILQPEPGTIPKGERLKMRDKDGYTECYLPDVWQGKIDIDDIVLMKKGSEIFGFRVPSTGKHSLVALKVKGFYPSKDQNIIIVPSEITYTSGTDYDIDTLYILRKHIAKKNVYAYTVDEDGKMVRGELLAKSGDVIGSEKHEAAFSSLMSVRANKKKIDKQAASILDSLNDVYEQSLINDIIDNYVNAIKNKRNDEMFMFPIYSERINRKPGRKSEVGPTVLDRLVIAVKKTYGVELNEKVDGNLLDTQVDGLSDIQKAKMLKGRFVNFQKGVSYAYQAAVEYINKEQKQELKKEKLTIDEYIDQLKQLGEITYTDEDGNLCAAEGARGHTFTRGSKWEIVEDLKGYPSHANGGVDLVIGDGGVSFKNNKGVDYIAEDGLLLPKVAKPAEIIKFEKPNVNIKFLTAKQLVNTSSPATNKIKQDEFMKRLSDLNSLSDSLWES